MCRPSFRRFVDCDEAGAPTLGEEETLDFTLDDVSVAFSALEKEVFGPGKLFITSSRVMFLSEGLQFDYDVPYIVLHAITRDPENYPLPCVYCQLDEESESAGTGDAPTSELFLLPPDEENLMRIFDALSDAALKNPDVLEDGTEDGQQDFIFSEEEMQQAANASAQNANALDYLDSVFLEPDTTATIKQDDFVEVATGSSMLV